MTQSPFWLLSSCTSLVHPSILRIKSSGKKVRMNFFLNYVSFKDQNNRYCIFYFSEKELWLVETFTEPISALELLQVWPAVCNKRLLPQVVSSWHSSLTLDSLSRKERNGLKSYITKHHHYPTRTFSRRQLKQKCLSESHRANPGGRWENLFTWFPACQYDLFLDIHSVNFTLELYFQERTLLLRLSSLWLLETDSYRLQLFKHPNLSHLSITILYFFLHLFLTFSSFFFLFFSFFDVTLTF